MTDEEIYRQHADHLVRFATGLVGPFDAHDVVTDACLAAFRSRTWPAVNNHRAYLYRSVLNHARSHHRSTLRRRVRELRAATPDTAALTDVDVDVLTAVNKLSVQRTGYLCVDQLHGAAQIGVEVEIGGVGFLVGLVMLAGLVLLVMALVDLVGRSSDVWVRSGHNQLVWALIVILVGFIGPALYLLIARPALNAASRLPSEIAEL